MVSRPSFLLKRAFLMGAVVVGLIAAIDAGGALLQSSSTTLPQGGSAFTEATLAVATATPAIQSIRFRGGTESFSTPFGIFSIPNSVYYDNFTIAVPEPGTVGLAIIASVALWRCRPRVALAGMMAIAVGMGFGGSAEAQVTNFRLFKEAYHSQSGPSTVQLDFWAMDANILASADYATDILLTPPAPGVPLSDSVVDGFWEVFLDFPTRAALDTAYPDGTYSYEISGGTGGSQSATLTMPDDFFPSVVPQLTEATFNGMGGADPTLPFTVEWNSFLPDVRAANARVRFGLIDLTANDFPIFAGNLPPTTTEYLLPANTLIPGHDYELLLIFSNAITTANAGFGTATSLVDANRSVALYFTAVPEPSSCALLLISLGGFLQLRRRRNS